MRLRDIAQEVYETGPLGFGFRVGWEGILRSGVLGCLPTPDQGVPAASTPWDRMLPFYDPITVAQCMRGRIPQTHLDQLRAQAMGAVAGRIFCFSATTRDFQQPIDWHLQPATKKRWPSTSGWWRTLQDGQQVGDIKLTWEIGRFPQAYAMARAAAYFPALEATCAKALQEQIECFVDANPLPLGVHWASGQEVAIRAMAWIFSLSTLLSRSEYSRHITNIIARAIAVGTAHIERYLIYSRVGSYNNHLTAEALGLLLGGTMLPHLPQARRWRESGWKLMCSSAERQIYDDGSYINQSHNYHRVMLQYLIWADMLAKAVGEEPDPSWHRAMDRSLTFLLAHQDPRSGALPNYGANDGALPSPLSTAAFPDFRPTLQLASIIARGERIYDVGFWDEEAVWVLGPDSLDAPLKPPAHTSVSFEVSGYHVLRGCDPSSFVTFRCGPTLERFSQIDMLHLDVWWRGHNVLVDGGSYSFNGPAQWHRHFVSTAAHNTVALDGRDQMLHHRPFKNIYLGRAKLLGSSDAQDVGTLHGEHYGYRRHAGKCVHRRSVLYFKDDTWVVLDTILGDGQHHARLHWLGKPGAYVYDTSRAQLMLSTPSGPFYVSTFDTDANPLRGTVVAGQHEPPRGWQARRYSCKDEAPSLAIEHQGPTPMAFISILSAYPAMLRRSGVSFFIEGSSKARFTIRDHLLHADTDRSHKSRT